MDEAAIEAMIEEAAKAMCIAEGISPEAASIGSDMKTYRAWEGRLKIARAACAVAIKVCAEEVQKVASDQQDVPPNLAAGVRSGANTAAYRLRCVADAVEGK